MQPALKTTMFRLAVMLSVWTAAGPRRTMLKFVFSNSLNKSGAEHEKFDLSRYISDTSAALVVEAYTKVDVLRKTFSTLKARTCLPSDFDFNALQPEAGECATKLNGQVPPNCAGASKLGMFYNCYAVGSGRLDSSATLFNIALHETETTNYSNDVTWRALLPKLLALCKRMSSAQHSPMEQTLYSFFCLKWSLFADCDRQQSKKSSLDAEGLLRRAKFLSGDCPLSPSSLLDAFGVVTGKTWEECSQGLYAGTDASQLYEAQVFRVSCLLQNFQTTASKVDFSKLVDAVTAADQGHDVSTILLLKVIGDCATSGGLKAKGKNQFNSMTSAEFIKCWAQDGVLSCAQQEANQEASKYPEACKIFVEN